MTMILTKSGAKEIARRSWKSGEISLLNLKRQGKLCRVGYIEYGFFTIKGQGQSWEEAFKDAGVKYDL